jgi:hypothetical protein
MWGYVSLSTTSRVWMWGCIPFHHKQGVDVRLYSFPPQAGCGCEVVFFPPPAGYGREVVQYSFPLPAGYGREVEQYSFPLPAGYGRGDVSVSSVSIVDVRVYPFLPPTVWTWRCFPFHHQQWWKEVSDIPAGDGKFH